MKHRLQPLTGLKRRRRRFRAIYRCNPNLEVIKQQLEDSNDQLDELEQYLLQGKLPQAKLNRWHVQVSWDIPDVKFIKKFYHGTSDPYNPLTDEEMDAQLEKINKELRYGKIVAVETGINDFEVDGRSVISQWTVILIGYKNRPDGM